MKNTPLISIALALGIVSIFVNIILSIHGSDLLIPFSIAATALEIFICLLVDFFIKPPRLSQVIIISMIVASTISQLFLWDFTLWVGRQVENRNNSSLRVKIINIKPKYSKNLLTGVKVDLDVQAEYPSDYSIYVDVGISPADRSAAYRAFRKAHPDGVLTTNGQYNRFTIHQLNNENISSSNHLKVNLTSNRKYSYSLSMMPLYAARSLSDKKCINKFKTDIENQFYNFLKKYDQQLSILVKVSVGGIKKDKSLKSFSEKFSSKIIFHNMEYLFNPC